MRYQGIATVETVKTKLAAAFGLANTITAQFLGDQETAMLADIPIRPDGLELRVIGSDMDTGSPNESFNS
jgi:hypothetical protein